MPSDIHKSDDEYRARLTPEQYRVTREKGTEMPFTGEYWNHKEDGHVPLRLLRGGIVSLRDKV